MSTIEDRLRADLHAIAQQAQPQTLRPLRSPAPRHRSTTRRWVAATAAVAAVAAIIAGVNIAAHRMPKRPPAAPAAPMPPYYLYSSIGATSLTVRASATGKVIATLKAPAHRYYTFSSPASGDRTFALVDSSAVSRSAKSSFLLLRLSANGQPAALTRLHYSAAGGSNDIIVWGTALSPDGSMLAVATIPTDTDPNKNLFPGTSRITLVSVATGKVLRSWAAPSSVTPTGLSWVRGTGISFTTTDTRSPAVGPAVTQLRLLPAASPGGELLRASKAIPLNVPNGGTLSSASVTPDGSKILAWTYTVSDTSNIVTVLSEYSRGGALIRVLYGEPVDRTLINMVWPVSMDPSAQHVLIQTSNPRGQVIFGRIDNGRFTRLASFNDGILAAQLGSW